MKSRLLKFAFPLFVALATHQISAQTIITKWYGLGGRAEEVPTRIRTIGNSILAVGWGKIGTGTDTDLMLRRIDTAGQTQFFLMENLPDDQVGYDVCSDDAGNFIV